VQEGSDSRVKQEPLDDAKILSTLAETLEETSPPSNSNLAALYGEPFVCLSFCYLICLK
jgi:hypothetical protein